jgi:hypothetical protein
MNRFYNAITTISRMHLKHRIQTLSLLILILSSGVLSGQTGFDGNFESSTLRIDYLHTGNHQESAITLHKLIREPYWAGSKRNLIDTFGYGRYHFEVCLKETGAVIYSRGFSTLFVEWQDTDEAKVKEKTFKESLVMPFPKHEVVVKIYRRDKQNKLHLLFSTTIHPAKDPVFVQEPLPYPVFDLMINGPTEDKLDILFIAEGYTYAERQTFVRDCATFAGYLLGTSPFGANQERINIRGVGTPSEASGVTIPGDSIFLNTALGASFYTLGSERYLMVEDFHRVRDIAALAPYDQIFIIVNSDKYGGGGIYNFYATGTRGNKAADFLLIHEFGHSFAGLGDEYYTSEVAVESFYDLKTEPWEPNITTLVDFSAKWADLISPSTPVPTPLTPEYSNTTGVFEGGGYQEKGIYRPYTDCTMKSVKYDAFCPVCKRSIERMIKFYSE